MFRTFAYVAQKTAIWEGLRGGLCQPVSGMARLQL